MISPVPRPPCSASTAEWYVSFAAMGTCITRHIFNKADHRNIRLLEQADGARCVDCREILWRRYDDRARWLVLLNHRKLHVPGAGRQEIGRASCRERVCQYV